MEKILLLGSGARESALAWGMLQSPKLDKLFTAPGMYPGAIQATGLDPMDIEKVRDFVVRHGITMVVPGYEELIASGIADALEDLPVRVVAPTAEAGRLESDKEYAKEFMSDYGIPTPRWMSVSADTLEEGLAFLKSGQPPYVLKANGLAQGIGVHIVESLSEARDLLRDMLDGLYGEASQTVIIEEFVPGRECSVFVAVNGDKYKILTTAQDYKRVGSGNRGPNTRGMGSVSPAPFADDAFLEKIESTIIRPTLAGLRDKELHYSGILYLGIMEIAGIPLLLEYNVRLGDPETQAIVPRLKTDVIEIMKAIADNRLEELKVEFTDNVGVSVVLAAPGYPSAPEVGNPVTGLGAARETGVLVLPGEIGKDGTGKLVTRGPRILTVADAAPTAAEAAEKIRAAISKIESPGAFYRHDIGAEY